MSYKETPIPPLGVEEQEPTEVTKDTELPSTEDIQPLSVQVQVQVQEDKPVEEPSIVIPKAKANLPYPALPKSSDNHESDKSPIEEPKHSFNMGYEHFNTNLVTNYVAESSTKNLVPIPHESKVTSENGSESIEPVKDNSLVLMTFSNLLLDNDKISFDELNSHVESNSDESTSNHDTERDPHQEEIDVVTQTDDVLPPSVENDDSDEEVSVVNLRVDNSISNPEHEYFESEDSDFDNPSIPLPPPEPPDEEFDFEKDF
nr:hypothetical protein [Tanacetum cinerariifolium]